MATPIPPDGAQFVDPGPGLIWDRGVEPRVYLHGSYRPISRSEIFGEWPQEDIDGEMARTIREEMLQHRFSIGGGRCMCGRGPSCSADPASMAAHTAHYITLKVQALLDERAARDKH